MRTPCRALEQVAPKPTPRCEVRNRIVDIKVQQNEQRRMAEAQLKEAGERS